MEKKIKTDEEETRSSSGSDSSPSPYLVTTPSQISGVFFLGSWNRQEFEDAGRTRVFGLCEKKLKKREHSRKERDYNKIYRQI